MEEKIIYDFDNIVDRAGTHSEKYDALKGISVPRRLSLSGWQIWIFLLLLFYQML